MKVIRFQAKEGTFFGRLEGDKILSMDKPALPRNFLLDEVRLLAPTVTSKVVCIGLNYRDHAKELNLTLPEEPLLFLKPSTSVIGPGDEIVMPKQSSRVDYEAELGVVIGRIARKVSRKAAKDHILGYTCLNDVTARDLQSKDGQWTRAKGFDTFCPIGPWIETDVDPKDLDIRLFVNGEQKQASRTSNLIFDPYALVEFISHVMTLMPGDVIATGTPAGIGPLKSGDSVEVRIEGVGSLTNRVVAD
jgi:2-keto-4-pentenoate hydratase/2-oxohepta-3-ene-1,7-dioic acid hydratase in catechol pathway